MISLRRQLAFSIATVGLAGSVFSVSEIVAAQRSPTPLAVIAEMADAAMNALIGPESSLSGVRVATRTILFDRRGTLEAFGYRGATLDTAQIPLRASVGEGTGRLLDDCNQLGSGTCARLGWSVYVKVAPVTLSDTVAVIDLVAAWPDRGRAEVVPGVPPAGRAYLAGSTAKVYLRRDSTKAWRFWKIGVVEAGD